MGCIQVDEVDDNNPWEGPGTQHSNHQAFNGATHGRPRMIEVERDD